MSNCLKLACCIQILVYLLGICQITGLSIHRKSGRAIYRASGVASPQSVKPVQTFSTGGTDMASDWQNSGFAAVAGGLIHPASFDMLSQAFGQLAPATTSSQSEQLVENIAPGLMALVPPQQANLGHAGMVPPVPEEGKTSEVSLALPVARPAPSPPLATLVSQENVEQNNPLSENGVAIEIQIPDVEPFQIQQEQHNPTQPEIPNPSNYQHYVDLSEQNIPASHTNNTPLIAVVQSNSQVESNIHTIEHNSLTTAPVPAINQPNLTENFEQSNFAEQHPQLGVPAAIPSSSQVPMEHVLNTNAPEDEIQVEPSIPHLPAAATVPLTSSQVQSQNTITQHQPQPATQSHPPSQSEQSLAIQPQDSTYQPQPATQSHPPSQSEQSLAVQPQNPTSVQTSQLASQSLHPSQSEQSFAVQPQDLTSQPQAAIQSNVPPQSEQSLTIQPQAAMQSHVPPQSEQSLTIQPQNPTSTQTSKPATESLHPSQSEQTLAIQPQNPTSMQPSRPQPATQSHVPSQSEQSIPIQPQNPTSTQTSQPATPSLHPSQAEQSLAIKPQNPTSMQPSRPQPATQSHVPSQSEQSIPIQPQNPTSMQPSRPQPATQSHVPSQSEQSIPIQPQNPTSMQTSQPATSSLHPSQAEQSLTIQPQNPTSMQPSRPQPATQSHVPSQSEQSIPIQPQNPTSMQPSRPQPATQSHVPSQSEQSIPIQPQNPTSMQTSQPATSSLHPSQAEQSLTIQPQNPTSMQPSRPQPATQSHVPSQSEQSIPIQPQNPTSMQTSQPATSSLHPSQAEQSLAIQPQDSTSTQTSQLQPATPSHTTTQQGSPSQSLLISSRPPLTMQAQQSLQQGIQDFEQIVSLQPAKPPVQPIPIGALQSQTPLQQNNSRPPRPQGLQLQDSLIALPQGWSALPQNELGWNQSVQSGHNAGGNQIMNMAILGNQANFAGTSDVNVQVNSHGTGGTTNTYNLGRRGGLSKQPVGVGAPALGKLQFQIEY